MMMTPEMMAMMTQWGSGAPKESADQTRDGAGVIAPAVPAEGTKLPDGTDLGAVAPGRAAELAAQMQSMSLGAMAVSNFGNELTLMPGIRADEAGPVGEGKGIVTKYNHSRGFGFIMPEGAVSPEDELFAHWKEIVNGNSLIEGKEVRYTPSVGKRGKP